MKSLTPLFSLPVLALGAGLALFGCDDGDGDSDTATTVGTTTVTTSTTGTTSDVTTETTGNTSETTETTDTTTGNPVDCTGVEGTTASHVIVETEADLAELDGAAHVNGDLWITETALTNLDAIACIKTVAGNLYVFGNKSLTDASGLGALESVGGSFTFSDNIAVTSFPGAPGVTTVEDLTFSGNDALQSITGFGSLTTVNGHFLIQINDSLADISGFGALQTVAKSLKVTQNPNLCIGHIEATLGEVQIGDVSMSSTAENKSGC